MCQGRTSFTTRVNKTEFDVSSQRGVAQKSNSILSFKVVKCPIYRRLKIHVCTYVDGLGASYARSFLASTHARFYKELDREMSNKRRF